MPEINMLRLSEQLDKFAGLRVKAISVIGNKNPQEVIITFENDARIAIASDDGYSQISILDIDVFHPAFGR